MRSGHKPGSHRKAQTINIGKCRHPYRNHIVISDCGRSSAIRALELKRQVQLEKELFSVAGGILWNTVIASIAQASLEELNGEIFPHES